MLEAILPTEAGEAILVVAAVTMLLLAAEAAFPKATVVVEAVSHIAIVEVEATLQMEIAEAVEEEDKKA